MLAGRRQAEAASGLGLSLANKVVADVGVRATVRWQDSLGPGRQRRRFDRIRQDVTSPLLGCCGP